MKRVTRIRVGVVAGACALVASGLLPAPAFAGPQVLALPLLAPSDPPCTAPSATSSPTATSSATATATTSPSPSGGGGLPIPLPLPGGGSPSPSATPTATTSPTATSSPGPACVRLTLSVRPKDIVPTQTSTAVVTGSSNSTVDLYAYSRPSTTYTKVRSGTTDPNGRISWDLKPGTNTRLYAHYASGSGTTGPSDSPSTVLTVHTSLSLSAYRDGVRKYHFQGTNLPRRAGQLITLYRYASGPNLDQYCVPTAESDTTVKTDGACKAIITSQAKTGANNTWRIDRTFTGDGRFYFVVRTSDNLNNGRGHSNQRLTIIH
ncbi:MAG: hypothetical protein JJD92_15000 [Frankiaceae bacterium]|nr:hypothetical protein [Frankiaceae bacterium]